MNHVFLAIDCHGHLAAMNDHKLIMLLVPGTKLSSRTVRYNAKSRGGPLRMMMTFRYIFVNSGYSHISTTYLDSLV